MCSFREKRTILLYEAEQLFSGFYMVVSCMPANKLIGAIELKTGRNLFADGIFLFISSSAKFLPLRREIVKDKLLNSSYKRTR